jgi:hypothetical protein
MSLYIVPPDGGNGGAPSKRRRSTRPSVTLNPDQASGLAATLKNLNRRHSWAVLAAEMGVSKDALRYAANGHTRGSPGLAVLVARVAGLSVERVLTPGPTGTSCCPNCGRPL